MFVTVLTKSAAGITIRAADGKTYKADRKDLSAQTVADLALPVEERTNQLNEAAAKTETTDAAGLKKKNEDLERRNAALQQENEALRAQSSQSTPAAKPAVEVQTATNNATYRVVGLPKNSPGLNIREGPGIDHRIVGSFGPTAIGITLGPGREHNGGTVWQEVVGDGYRGWVNAEYLTVENTAK